MGLSLVAGLFWSPWDAMSERDTRLFNNCEIERVFSDFIGAPIWVAILMVRFHRLKKVLVDHDTNMSSPAVQLFKVWLFIPIGHYMRWIEHISMGLPESFAWDPETHACAIVPPVFPLPGSRFEFLQPVFAARDNIITNLPYAVLYVYAVYAILKLRTVRAQYREFHSTMTGLLIAAIGFIPMGFGLDRPYHSVFYMIIVNAMFWSIMAEPFYHLIKGDLAYVMKFTNGFPTLPTSEQLNGTLEQQLTLPQVRKIFAVFAGNAKAKESLEFYEACLERQKLQGWFERQAKTMAIIERHINVGSPGEINISDQERTAIITGDINDFKLFEKAKKEVLHLMEGNLSYDFDGSQSMVELRRTVAEVEQLKKDAAALSRAGSRHKETFEGLPGQVLNARSTSSKTSSGMGSSSDHSSSSTADIRMAPVLGALASSRLSTYATSNAKK